MYNALGGLGGSGQVDSTVAANATVALLSGECLLLHLNIHETIVQDQTR